MDDALKKAKNEDNVKGPLAAVIDDLMTLIQLVKAYFKGEYRDISWESIASAIGAIIYFVSPIDLVPDWLLGIGYVDDALIIGWVIKSIYVELSNFRKWQSAQESTEAREA